MAESQADRLKKELRFLKESYEAGIINEEEYNKGKKRIDEKLAEWGDGVVEAYRDKEEPKKKEIVEDSEEETEDEKPQEIDERQEKLRGYGAKKKDTKKDEEEFEEYDNENDEEESKEKKKFSMWKIIAIAAIFIIMLIFLISQGKYSINTDLVILNDKNCASCDTRSAENVIDKLFPGLTKEYVDYNTRKGKAIYNDLGITYLPAYIFTSSIENTQVWNGSMKNSFEKRKEYYILKPDQTSSKWKP